VFAGIPADSDPEDMIIDTETYGDVTEYRHDENLPSLLVTPASEPTAIDLPEKYKKVIVDSLSVTKTPASPRRRRKDWGPVTRASPRLNRTRLEEE
jgi:hypothetical protein